MYHTERRYIDMGNLNSVYREILEKEGLTQEQAAKVCGYAGQSTVARKLNYGMSVDGICDLTDRLGGYRLVLEKVKPNGKIAERYELER